MRIFAFGSSSEKENQEPPSIFAPGYNDDAWTDSKIKQLNGINLGEDNFCLLALCHNAQIVRRLHTRPPLVKMAQHNLNELAAAIVRSEAVPEVVLCCAKGLFFRRATDVLLASQIKKPTPDYSIILLSCALSELAIAHMHAVYKLLQGEFKSLAALEMLEANTLIKVNLPREAQKEMNELLNGNLSHEVWTALDLPFPIPNQLFEDLKRMPCKLDDDMVEKCTIDLWNMREATDFLRRASWILNFEPISAKVLPSWCDSLPKTPSKVSTSVKELTAMDVHLFLLAVGSWAASAQYKPEPLFPATLAQVHPVSGDQLDHWRAVQSAIDSGKIDMAAQNKINSVIDSVRLRKAPQGLRLAFSLLKFLRDHCGEDLSVWTEKYANRMVELIMGVDAPLSRHCLQLFPRSEMDIGVDEEEVMHEQAAIFLALAEASRGDFGPAEGRLIAFDGHDAKRALIKIYNMWSERVSGPMRDLLVAKIMECKKIVGDIEDNKGTPCKEPTPQRVVLSKTPEREVRITPSRTPQTSMISTTPSRSNASTSMGRDASTTMNTSVLDDSFQSVFSSTQDASFVSAVSGRSDVTPVGTPQKPALTGSSVSNRSMAQFTDSPNIMSVSQVCQPAPVVEEFDTDILKMVESFQSKLKVQQKENDDKMKKATIEANEYVSKMEKENDEAKKKKALSPNSKTKSTVLDSAERARKLDAIESALKYQSNGQQQFHSPFHPQYDEQEANVQLLMIALWKQQQQAQFAKDNRLSTMNPPMPSSSSTLSAAPFPFGATSSSSNFSFGSPLAKPSSGGLTTGTVPQGSTSSPSNSSLFAPRTPSQASLATSSQAVNSPPTPQEIAAQTMQKLRITFNPTPSTPKSSTSSLKNLEKMCAHPDAAGKWCAGCLSDDDTDKVLRILHQLALKWDQEND